MAQYIQKDAVMSVIDKKLSYYKDLESRGLLSKEGDAAFRAVRILKSDINFLEVKEVDLDFTKEPVSEDLESEIQRYYVDWDEHPEYVQTARHFAKWQKEQFEKERLKHCDELTTEQAQIESDFVTQHLKENNRTPTFIDAIEYGMRLHKEQMMKDAKSGIGNYDNYIKFEDGTWIDLDPSEQLKPAFNVNEGDKVKVIVIKED